ncbi:MAG: ATP citrate synthase [Deltaproteobacteria bacterium]|nr:ATP citrate synthase [Deltaproteobacteria bacterium]
MKVAARKAYSLFDRDTLSIVYGLQEDAIQRMLDFDYLCRREQPSVAAIVNPTGEGWHQCFFGSREVLIPIYRTLKQGVENHPNADVLVNFASFRSAYSTTKEALETKTIRTIAVIAEGVPEKYSRELAHLAKKMKKWVIGPATVGGIAPGAFRIGNTAGALDNIIESKLYRPGHVAYISKSGGLSNEINSIIALNSDGVYEGIAIGGDRYPGSAFIDHLMRYEANPEIKMMVMLGEVGGMDEYEVVEALTMKKITKPLVAWNIGTCSKVFPAEVQFGHAGARAGNIQETADAKNRALREAGAIVPNSFDDLDRMIKETFDKLLAEGKAMPTTEVAPPPIPQDYKAARKAGLVRRAANFICTISDERGDEPSYAGVQISEVIEKGYSIGDVISLLWFKKLLPKWATEFIEIIIKISADHGPAVSGAHNAIVTARAGKDVISSLASGLLTIGPRFGGAIDDAARYFKKACDAGKAPEAFVDEVKRLGINIPGIGHRVKSLNNPDKRVEVLKNYAYKNFPKTKYLDYAVAVEKVTTQKRNTLILNVDGCIGASFLDLLNACGSFSTQEIEDIVEIGYLNAIFTLARAIGLIGHIFDQKRLKTDLYRHSWDDILYMVEKPEKR